MSVKIGAVTGVVIGAGTAIILLSLEYIRPFSVNGNAFIGRLIFRLCPFYRLGFANGMGGMAGLVIVTILGNAILYGLAPGLLAAVLRLFRRKPA